MEPNSLDPDERADREQATERYLRRAIEEDPAQADDPLSYEEVCAFLAADEHPLRLYPTDVGGRQEGEPSGGASSIGASAEVQLEGYRRVQARAMVRGARAARADQRRGG